MTNVGLDAKTYSLVRFDCLAEINFCGSYFYKAKQWSSSRVWYLNLHFRVHKISLALIQGKKLLFCVPLIIKVGHRAPSGDDLWVC